MLGPATKMERAVFQTSMMHLCLGNERAACLALSPFHYKAADPGANGGRRFLLGEKGEGRGPPQLFFSLLALDK